MADSAADTLAHLRVAIVKHVADLRSNFVTPPAGLIELAHLLANATDTPPDAPDAPADLLTYKQAAARLNVGRSTLFRIFASGELPVVRIGGTPRVRVADLDAYIAKR